MARKGFKVKANISGNRIITDKTFRTRGGAEKFATETNKFRPGARARVVRARR